MALTFLSTAPQGQVLPPAELSTPAVDVPAPAASAPAGANSGTGLLCIGAIASAGAMARRAAAGSRKKAGASKGQLRAEPVSKAVSWDPAPQEPTVSSLDPARVALLKGHGVTLKAIEPMGAKVAGLDLKGPEPPAAVLEALQAEMAARGFLVFSGQGVLSGDEQCKASELWGGREMHSTHGVHPKAPNRHIFRLSNDPAVGINGVGPQWHNDGSFEVDVFSHVGYHIIRVPENNGDTLFAHQGGAFDALPRATQEFWSRLVSVNASSGVLHPMVHEHPISGRRSVYLHLGMTGGVLEKIGEDQFRLLGEDELQKLFHSYNDLLNSGLPDNGGNYAISYQYQEGDCIFIDNLALAHKASPEAHLDAKEQGLRILHRTTVKAMKPLLPGFNLPSTATQELLNDAQQISKGKGVFVAGGLGFRWDSTIRMQN